MLWAFGETACVTGPVTGDRGNKSEVMPVTAGENGEVKQDASASSLQHVSLLFFPPSQNSPNTQNLHYNRLSFTTVTIIIIFPHSIIFNHQ